MMIRRDDKRIEATTILLNIHIPPVNITDTSIFSPLEHFMDQYNIFNVIGTVKMPWYEHEIFGNIAGIRIIVCTLHQLRLKHLAITAWRYNCPTTDRPEYNIAQLQNEIVKSKANGYANFD